MPAVYRYNFVYTRKQYTFGVLKRAQHVIYAYNDNYTTLMVDIYIHKPRYIRINAREAALFEGHARDAGTTPRVYPFRSRSLRVVHVIIYLTA